MDLIIWKLPAGNRFNIGTMALRTVDILAGIYPFPITSSTVTENIMAIGFC
jgi:hypothetical protein